MNQIPVAHSRAPQILHLLNEYGPLSVTGLETIIRPRIAKRRLQEALKRLYEKGLVIRRFEASPFSRQYYELSQSADSQKQVHKLTGIPIERLNQPYFRSQELLHNEECTFWAYYLKEMFPDAEVVRDFQFKNHKKLLQILDLSGGIDDVQPDIVLLFPSSGSQEFVKIFFEVELTRKSDIRLHQKIRKYCNESWADGVVYLCHKNSLVNTLRSIYEKHLMKNCFRIKHYEKLFFLFGSRAFNVETLEPVLTNTNGQNVSFKAWVDFLREVEFNKRRNEILAKPA